VTDTGLQGLLQDLASQERHSPRSDVVRLAVRLRARDACEYCLLPTVGQFHVAHVTPPRAWPSGAAHGPDHVDNYAWCCPFCNASRAARTELGGQRLFDPRRDHWREHFAFAQDYLVVLGTTAVGRATEAALDLNSPRYGRHVTQRYRALLENHYPPAWARSYPSIPKE